MDWKKHPAEPNTYLFEKQGQPFGEIRFNAMLSTAECVFGDLRFRIEKKNFWACAPRIVLPDTSIKLMARSESWHGHTQLLQVGTKIFKARWQNAPSAELIVYEHDRKYPLLSVGLKSRGWRMFTELHVRDEAYAMPELPYLLAYAWYSFLPASKQGMDDILVMVA